MTDTEKPCRIGEFARRYQKSVERVRQLDHVFKPKLNFGQREYGAKQHRIAAALWGDGAVSGEHAS